MALTDSINIIEPEAPDTIAAQQEPVFGIVLSPEHVEVVPVHSNDPQTGVSLILTGIFILFLIISLRFRNNMKYVGAMFRDLVDTRTRHNVFDDTVSETYLLVLLNLLWCVSAGITAYCCIQAIYFPSSSIGFEATGLLAGMGIACAYVLFMIPAYYFSGCIFSSREYAALWVKGFVASQALMTPFIFIISLIALCWPGAEIAVAVAAAVIFIMVRLVFIWKGMRIFFNQSSSWVLFLCYLCSLEIVPLVLTCRLAFLLGDAFA